MRKLSGLAGGKDRHAVRDGTTVRLDVERGFRDVRDAADDVRLRNLPGRNSQQLALELDQSGQIERGDYGEDLALSGVLITPGRGKRSRQAPRHVAFDSRKNVPPGTCDERKREQQPAGHLK